MEEVPESEQMKWALTRDEFVQELKKATRIAAPMVAVTVLQYLVQVVSMVAVGHLGQLSLSSVAIATSLANVTGFSLHTGLAGGLETLCGQAYGAGQYQKLRDYLYSAVISLILVCLPICILWIFMDKFLELMHQDHVISQEARKYLMWLIPALLGGAILKPLVRFLQTQSLILPMLLTSFLVLCFHIPLCWILVYKLELGSPGAALACSISTWLNVTLLGFYMVFSSACERTRGHFTRNAFLGIPEFFRFGVPSAFMICLKWWSCELLTLLSGLSPNPKLETSVLSICFSISTLHFTISYGFRAAASTRVSNELGAGNPNRARVAVLAILSLASIEAVIMGTALFCCRHVLGYAYSNEKQVVHYIGVMTPLVCLSIFMDSLQAVLSGVATGTGWQHIGAYINLGAFYLIGLPTGVISGFVLHLRAKGLWIGVVSGTAVQLALLFLVTGATNWQKQANKVRNRIFAQNSYQEQREQRTRSIST
ncbi:protein DETOXIFICATION 14-like [Rhodamnia argentea]|uniref:Protein DETOXIFICATION n=1 Tax=Rhodamnia argentea TaxID=178133 RepID=A0A8B8PRE7_9MYRT|nr:protein DETOXIFICATION 14-like [Rhodamnia argentea]